jgi:hypothetical protein
MNDVVAVWLARGGALPQLVIQSRRWIYRAAMTDRRANAGDPRASHADAAQLAGLHAIKRLAHFGRAAALRAELHAAVVLGGGLDHQLPFPRIVAGRLFDVDVLARLAGEHRGRGVPVIGGSDHQGVDRRIVEHAAEIGFLFGLLPALTRQRSRGLRGHFAVDIADGGDVDSLLLGEGQGERMTATVRAHHGDREPIVGRARA